MKIRKISIFLTTVLLFTGLFLASCSTKWEYYNPSNDISFSTDGAIVSLTGTPITVTVQRGNADKAITVPFNLRDTSGVFALAASSVDFAAGEYKKTVQILYKVADLVPANNYRFTVSLADKNMAGAGSFSAYGVVASLPLTYKPYGTVSITSGSLLALMNTSTAFVEDYALYKADYTTNYYKIIKAFDSSVDLELKVGSDGAVEVTSPAPTSGGWFSSKMIVITTNATDPWYSKNIGLQFSSKGYVKALNMSTSGNLLVVGSALRFTTFHTLSDNTDYYANSSGTYWFYNTLQVTGVK